MARLTRPSRRRGAMTVEFALCVNFGLLPFYFGIIDWSWYLWRAMFVQSALRDAALTGASVDMDAGTCPGVMAESELDDRLSTAGFGGATITSVLTDGVAYGVGWVSNIDQMTVTVSVPFSPIIGILPIPDAMGGTMTVPLEDQRGSTDCGV